MRHASVATAIETRRIASGTAFILMVEVEVIDGDGNYVETLRFCKNTENLEYPTGSGNIYQAANFDVNVNYTANEQPRITMSAKDYTGVIKERLETYDGIVGSNVILRVVNSDLLDQPAEFEETLTVMGSSAPGWDVNFTLGSENPLALRFPFNVQYRNRCPYRYKGERCGYDGALPSCDYTLDGANGCRVHNNIANYGGFPALRNLNI